MDIPKKIESLKQVKDLREATRQMKAGERMVGVGWFSFQAEKAVAEYLMDEKGCHPAESWKQARAFVDNIADPLTMF